MKDALRDAGIATAQSIGTSDIEEARRFVGRVGFPVILKPRDGAGAAGTFRADDAPTLDAAIAGSGLGAGASVAIEEFVEGHEGFLDTLTVGGTVAHEFVSHYYPGVLEAMRERWISPQIVTTNRIDGDDTYDEVKAMGRKVIEALGVETSATHMESASRAEVQRDRCRPPGVRMWDVYAAANEIDIYREWAHLIVHRTPEQRPSRRYAGGMIALRPDRDGVHVGASGVEEMQRLHGAHLIDFHIPESGTPTQGVEAGYMANGWVRARHEDYDALRSILDWIGENVRLSAR